MTMDHTENIMSATLFVHRTRNQNNNNRFPSFQAGNEGKENSQRALVLQEQWVTLTASMWPKPTTASAPRSGWRVPSDHLPLLAAVFCSAAFVTCLVFAFIIYRCCIMPRKEKHFSSRMKENPHNTPIPSAYQQNSAPSAVYAEAKQRGLNWGYSNRIVAPVPSRSPSQCSQWYQPATNMQCTHCPGICPPVPRSSSVPGPSNMGQPIYASLAYGGGGGPSTTNTTRKQRPLSQPINYDASCNGGRQVPMPEISEFSPHGTQGQYASSSILDEVGSKNGDDGEDSALKTRSLPAWVRNKPRPLSTEDDLNNLYAKVNFSKKRKNRMRNDEAAIIALSKSQYLHKDTDTLVDNEAVIVYDERTAL